MVAISSWPAARVAACARWCGCRFEPAGEGPGMIERRNGERLCKYSSYQDLILVSPGVPSTMKPNLYCISGVGMVALLREMPKSSLGMTIGGWIGGLG